MLYFFVAIFLIRVMKGRSEDEAAMAISSHRTEMDTLRKRLIGESSHLSPSHEPILFRDVDKRAQKDLGKVEREKERELSF